MATGASTADLAIILVDARKGVLHAVAPACLHRVAAGNPARGCGHQQDGPGRLSRGGVRAAPSRVAATLPRSLGIADLVFIPISALDGDNVVTAQAQMPWYTGPSLLEHLETVPVHDHGRAPHSVCRCSASFVPTRIFADSRDRSRPVAFAPAIRSWRCPRAGAVAVSSIRHLMET